MATELVVKDETNKSVTSHKSHHSNGSRSSKASPEHLELRRQEAALRARSAFDDEEAKLELMLRNLRTNRKLACIQAEKAVLEKYENESQTLNEPEGNQLLKDLGEEDKGECLTRLLDSQREEATPPPNLVAGHPPITTCMSNGYQGDLQMTIASLEKCMVQLVQSSLQQSILNQQMLAQAQLPKFDVPVFSGDPLSYPLWKNSFDSTVHCKPLDDGTKLNLLHKCVSGKPKEIVEHFVLIGSPDAYQQARESLTRRYGDPTIVSSAFTSKLNSWGKIHGRDSSGLQDFADCLLKVVAAKKSVKSLGILDFPQENAKLVEVLPPYLQNKWRDEIEQFKERHGSQEYPPFAVFVEFVRRAADRANIPELSTAVHDYQTRPANVKQVGKHARTFATDGISLEPSDKDRTPEAKSNTCPYCKENHLIEDCTSFKDITLEERRSFFFENRLCFGCGLSSNHRSNQCRARRMCVICQRRHLACFHSWQKRPNNQPEERSCVQDLTPDCGLIVGQPSPPPQIDNQVERANSPIGPSPVTRRDRLKQRT